MFQLLYSYLQLCMFPMTIRFHRIPKFKTVNITDENSEHDWSVVIASMYSSVMSDNLFFWSHLISNCNTWNCSQHILGDRVMFFWHFHEAEKRQARTGLDHALHSNFIRWEYVSVVFTPFCAVPKLPKKYYSFNRALQSLLLDYSLIEALAWCF